MTIRKLSYAPSAYYSPQTAKTQPRQTGNFTAQNTKKSNPKIAVLEFKIEELKGKLQANPDMLPAKIAEIEAEISKAEMELKSEPQKIDYLA